MSQACRLDYEKALHTGMTHTLLYLGGCLGHCPYYSRWQVVRA